MLRTRLLFTCGAMALLASTAATQPADFSFALTGDSIITRQLSVYQRAGVHAHHRPRPRRGCAVTNLEMLFHDYEPVRDERERRHLHARRTGAGEGAGVGRLRHGRARQQSRGRLRRAGDESDEQVRRRGRAGAGRRRAEPRRSARSQVPRNGEGAGRADFGRLDLHGSLPRGRRAATCPPVPG